jgi:predicted DNA-binding mobile mystery protein A
MPVRSSSVPQRGWIRSIREALGLSLSRVAKRAGIQRQNLLQFQISEERGQIKLANLRRIAEAMDCELVYAIIPKQTAIVDLATRCAEALTPSRNRRSGSST